MTRPLRAAQRTGLDRRLTRSSLPGRLPPALGAAIRLGTSGAGRLGPSGAGRLPERVAARGPRRAVVGMLTGCVQSVFFPQVNAATARVLAMEGCDVVIPRGQGCCGALSLHSGREAEAAAFARRTIEAFERAGVDAVVVNSAGCGSAMKEYERLLSDVPDWSGRAAAISVRDLSEFLAELGPAAPRHPLPVTAAYHDACHLGHAQRITRQPRELLRAIPDLTLVELPDAGTCCGSAGVYNLLQPEAASELGARRAQAVLDAHAPLLISANPGCSLQIAAALSDRGEHVTLAHIAESWTPRCAAAPADGPVTHPGQSGRRIRHGVVDGNASSPASSSVGLAGRRDAMDESSRRILEATHEALDKIGRRPAAVEAGRSAVTGDGVTASAGVTRRTRMTRACVTAGRS